MTASTTSLTVPPNARLIALMSARSACAADQRRCGPMPPWIDDAGYGRHVVTERPQSVERGPDLGGRPSGRRHQRAQGRVPVPVRSDEQPTQRLGDEHGVGRFVGAGPTCPAPVARRRRGRRAGWSSGRRPTRRRPCSGAPWTRAPIDPRGGRRSSTPPTTADVGRAPATSRRPITVSRSATDAGCRERGVAHVVSEVERTVVDPTGSPTSPGTKRTFWR